MTRRIAAFCLLIVLCFSCLNALGEESAASASFNRIRLGMSQKRVRWVMGVQPLKEPIGLGGYSALVYQTKVDGFRCTVQYSFLPGDILYSIEASVEDPDMEFFDMIAEEYTEQLGAPQSEDAEEAEEAETAEDLTPTDRDGETLIWQPDDGTMVVVSFDWSNDATQVVIWRTAEEFVFSTDMD